jgi:hypothetical protein
VCPRARAQRYLGDAAVAHRLEHDTREDFLQARVRHLCLVMMAL